MYKLPLITLVLVLFVALPVFAGPFLICQANPIGERVDSYQLNLNGEVINFQAGPVGQVGFKYDLAGKPDGLYTAKARAHNVFGWGPWSSEYTFHKTSVNIE
jgi:hypothetical protein